MRRVWVAALSAMVVVTLAVLAGNAVVREREYQALLIQGDRALADGQTYQAIEAFSGAIALRQDSMVAHLKRGEAYQLRGEYGAALRDLRVAARLDPSAVRPAELLGDVNYALDRFARAVESYQVYTGLDDASPRVHYKLGLSLFRHGDAAAALEPLRRAIALDSKLAEAHYVLGLCLKDRRQAQEAVRAFEEAVKIAPAMVPAREELVASYAALGRSPRVLDQLEAIAALEPNRPERQTAVALAYAAAGRTDTAVTVLGRAAERYPDNAGVFLTLGRVWLDAATPRRDRVALRKAIEALQTLARRPGASSEELALYGRALSLSGESGQAAAVLEQAVAALPIYPDALLWHAEAAERGGHLSRAREALEQWTVVAPASADRSPVFERIGEIHLRLGDSAAALRAFELAAQAPAPRASALAALARLQVAGNFLDAARATVERGLRLFPREPALVALQRRLR